MITVLLASVFTLQFPGGTPNEFTSALSTSTKQNVVVSQGQSRWVPGVRFENYSLTQMANAVRTQANHFFIAGTEMIFSDQLLPSDRITGGAFQKVVGFTSGVRFSHIQYDRSKVVPMKAPNFISLPESAVANGVVNFATKEEEALQINGLKGRFTKPIIVHWIYAEQPIYCQAKGMKELDFLTSVAKATGARFVPVGIAYRFDLDPAVIRLRAISSMNRISNLSLNQDKNSEENQHFRFRIACLNSLSPSQIAEVLATPNSFVRVQINRNTQLTNAVTTRIKQLEAVQKTYEPGGRSFRNAIGLLEKIDPDRPSYIVMDSKFYVMMEIAVKGVGNSPGTVEIL